jgi:hypothetical protein
MEIFIRPAAYRLHLPFAINFERGNDGKRDLSLSEQEAVLETTQRTRKARNELLNYASSERSLNFFKLNAEHHTKQAVIAHSVNKPLPYETRGFFYDWLCGDQKSEKECRLLRNFVADLEKAVGREFSF